MLSIRKIKGEDISEVSRLLCICYKWLCDVEDFSREYEDFLISKRGSVETIRDESESQQYLVACINDEIVGMTAVKGNEIAKLYIDPKWHNKGVGTKLFNAAEELIRKDGYANIILGVLGNSALPFYESMGMSVSGRKKSQAGFGVEMEVILMSKELNAK